MKYDAFVRSIRGYDATVKEKNTSAGERARCCIDLAPKDTNPGDETLNVFARELLFPPLMLEDCYPTWLSE